MPPPVDAEAYAAKDSVSSDGTGAGVKRPSGRCAIMRASLWNCSSSKAVPCVLRRDPASPSSPGNRVAGSIGASSSSLLSASMAFAGVEVTYAVLQVGHESC